MNIQTISIVVPTKGCVNKCPFCVSRMHDSPYENHWDKFEMEKRIKYAVMNGVNTCIITGTGEALQNTKFLINLGELFYKMNYPFPNVELQTTGVFLSECEDKFNEKGELYKVYAYINLLKHIGVNTISLSISNVFDDNLFDDNNMKVIGVSEKLKFNLSDLVKLLKEHGFNIRFSLNMLKVYDDYFAHQIIERCKTLGADQITFRKMYYDLDKDGFCKNDEGRWVKANKCASGTIEMLKTYIEGFQSKSGGGDIAETPTIYPGKGEFLYTLPFGGKVYSIEGMSVVIDSDCMSKENNESLKYVILRENGKLYCRWDDKGSLIF